MKMLHSWKPDPTCVVNPYDAERTRGEIRETLRVTRGCVFEMILKDNPTFSLKELATFHVQAVLNAKR